MNGPSLVFEKLYLAQALPRNSCNQLLTSTEAERCAALIGYNLAAELNSPPAKSWARKQMHRLLRWKQNERRKSPGRKHGTARSPMELKRPRKGMSNRNQQKQCSPWLLGKRKEGWKGAFIVTPPGCGAAEERVPGGCENGGSRQCLRNQFGAFHVWDAAGPRAGL